MDFFARLADRVFLGVSAGDPHFSAEGHDWPTIHHSLCCIYFVDIMRKSFTVFAVAVRCLYCCFGASGRLAHMYILLPIYWDEGCHNSGFGDKCDVRARVIGTITDNEIRLIFGDSSREFDSLLEKLETF